MSIHSLKVKSIQRLTSSAVCVEFDVPKTLKEAYQFQPGQYLSLETTINGERVRRSYSICSSNSARHLKVGIKAIPNGLFSNYVNNHLKSGDIVDVGTPEGRFVFEPSQSVQNIGAFAAGSGITPILSIACSVLDAHPKNRFVLVYGNRSSKESLFLSELQAMKIKYEDRFDIIYLFSRIPDKEGIFGRIDESTVHYILKNRHKNSLFSTFFLCGPQAMIETVEKALLQYKFTEDQIKKELFVLQSSTTTPEALNQIQLTITVDEETYMVEASNKKTLLDIALDAGIDAPYSCQGGVCSSCICMVTKGNADMQHNQILTDGEVKSGLVLACQAHAKTANIAIDFDIV